MTAALAIEPAKSRIRLIALSYANYNNTIPLPGSRIRGESGLAEPPTVTGRTSTKRRDELLLRLEHPKDEEPMTGRKDDSNVIAINRHAETMKHPFWGTLGDGLQTLRSLDGFGWRLVMETLVEPGDARTAFARIHALKYVAGGQYGSPVATPRAGLLKALLCLDKDVLPSGLTFPNFIHAQVESWEAWLAAIRPRVNSKGKTVRASTNEGRDLDPKAYEMRDEYIKELAAAGLTHQRIADELGVSRPLVTQVVGGGGQPKTRRQWIDPWDGRVYRDVTDDWTTPKLRVVEN